MSRSATLDWSRNYLRVPPEPMIRIAHRWRYARTWSVDRKSVWDEAAGIGAICDGLSRRGSEASGCRAGR